MLHPDSNIIDMDNCWVCCSSPEAEEQYQADRNRMMYVTSLSRASPRVEHSTVLARGLSQHNFPTHAQTPLEHHNEQRRVQLEKMRNRNVQLRSQVQGRRIWLWDRVVNLQKRSDQLRFTYMDRDRALQGLVGQINKHFK